MSAHTPGPWLLKGWTAPDDYGWSIKIGDAPHRLEVSAWDESSEANAHLIAAAPDLLAIAKETYKHLVLLYGDKGDWMVETLGAAIAKAEGNL